MAGGVTLQVRQIGSYALVGAAGAGDLILMQPGGLGNPYASVDAATLVQTALSDGSLGVGQGVPGNAAPGNIFTDSLVQPTSGSLFWNAYNNGGETYWNSGLAAQFGFNPDGFVFGLAPSGQAGQPVPSFGPLATIGVNGAMQLPQGTLTVARDPGAALEVATAGWVGNNTVASFNGRRGVVQLSSADIYAALCLDSCIATENWVNGQIQASLQLLLANHPFVFGWNGRTGAVYLTLADISCVFFQPGQQPITQTPPLTSNDYSIPNTQWVVEYIAQEFAGGGGNLATQSWVLANTVNSFNGRQGVVTLALSDVTNVGGAPLNSPQLSGIPTAPTAAPGQATGQIATTAFVQQAVAESTAGVASFNGRTGIVTLTNGDIVNAGGLANPSPNLTGNPTAPTQPAGTDLPLVATCEFVQTALSSGAVTSFNTRTGAVSLTLADVTGVGGAPLVSPAFSSVPTAPTAAPGTNTVQLATTAFVTAAVGAAGGVSSFNSRTGAVDLQANDVSAVGGLINPSVNLTGTPTAPTAAPGTNTTQLATTAFVQGALTTGAVTSFNTRTGAVTLQGADITGAGGALLASPAFSGTPTGPTAAPGTNNTQLANTAFVTAAIAASTSGVTSFNTRTGAVVLLAADITGAGGALLASPALSGTPTAPTAAPGTSTTQIATTAFVEAALAGSGVTSFNGRTGVVTLQANDLSAVGGALLASPAFSGTPTVPTAAAGTSTTQAASTAFVTSAVTTAPYIPHNYVDNSSFKIQQRAYASGTAVTAGVFMFDRWKAGSGGATVTWNAPAASISVTVTAGSMMQNIDAQNFINNTNYTLSWVGSAQGRVYLAGSGSPPAYASSPITVSLTTAMNTIEFTGGAVSQVQLQQGSIATPWQRTPVEIELARCQRYYYATPTVNFGGYSAAAGNQIIGNGVTLPVTMPTAPTVAIGTTGLSGTVTNVLLQSANTGATGCPMLAFVAACNGTGAFNGGMSFTASADI